MVITYRQGLSILMYAPAGNLESPSKLVRTRISNNGHVVGITLPRVRSKDLGAGGATFMLRTATTLCLSLYLIEGF